MNEAVLLHESCADERERPFCALANGKRRGHVREIICGPLGIQCDKWDVTGISTAKSQPLKDHGHG